ncbi:MAG: hypothetical protein RLZZ618_3134 [Pseudomonadota bacterium]
MNRREFSTHLAGLGCAAAGLSLTAGAWAQGKPVATTDYVTLGQPLSVEKGKIEVLEFFWYGCPHCFAFEPTLDAWQKKLPSDVAFRRVPVAFRESFVIHQRLFYAIEALGKVEELHRKVFQALHVERARLETDAEVLAFMVKNGVDKARFLEVFDSFSIKTKAKQATRLAEGYKIDGVPALGIAGKYFTSGSLAGSPDRALVVANTLIERARKGG